MGRKKQSTELDAFEKLSDALEVDFESKEILNKANEIQDHKKKIVAVMDKDEWSINDKIYMESEIKETICGLDDVMRLLRDDIKIGTKPRTHEVYASLAKIKIDAIKELRELNKNVVEMKLVKAKAAGTSSNKNIMVNNYNMNSNDLLDMVIKAKKNNSLNNIEAKFQIDEKDVAIGGAKADEI